MPNERDRLRKQEARSRQRLAVDGSPSHDRRQGAGDGADDRAEGRDALERRIDQDVNDKRRGAKFGRQRVDKMMELEESDDAEKAAKDQRLGGPYATAGDRPAGGAAHVGVVAALDLLIQHRGAAGEQGRCRSGCGTDGDSQMAMRRHVVANGGGRKDQQIHAA